MMNTVMKRRCEFCMGLCPIVYCKADAAHLCLFCDSKVHSANPLSYRHPRTLVCESCRDQPAFIRCFEHRMFMCQSCDASHHISSQHQKKVISCYVGCPSAKDLAALWGFNLNGLEGNSFSVTADSGAVNSNPSKVRNSRGEASSLVSETEGAISVLQTESSSSIGTKVVKNNNQQQSGYLILKQIQDLERLQLSEGVDNSCFIYVKERKSGLPVRHDATWKVHKTLTTQMEHFAEHLDLQNMGSPPEAKTKEPLSLPFPQLDHLTSTGNLLHGDSFWQCKSPAHNNEIWLQNMQDLGVCDEVKWFDAVNIPDVDLTFRNFEELFGSEHELSRPPVDDRNTACSFADKNPSFGKFDRGCESTNEGISGPSPIGLMQQPTDVDREINTADGVRLPQTSNYPIRPSYSTSSISVSRITGESSRSEYKDDGLSPAFPKPPPLPRGSSDSESTKLNAKGNVMKRHKEKKVTRNEKQAQHTLPRSKSDVKKRGKGEVLKAEHGSASATRSF